MNSAAMCGGMGRKFALKLQNNVSNQLLLTIWQKKTVAGLAVL